MSSNNTDHSDNLGCRYTALTNTTDTDLCEAASMSAEVIRWLPLLAANDFLDEDGLPPVA